MTSGETGPAPTLADRSQVFAAVLDLLRAQTGHALPVVAPGTALADIPDLDSLRVVEAVALAEQRFAVEIATSRLENLVTVADIVDALMQAPKPPVRG